MKISTFVFLLWVVLVSAAGCVVDYDIRSQAGTFNPQVVVNGLLTPDSTITVRLSWNKPYTDKNKFRPVEQFDVQFYEDEHLIADQSCSDGRFALNIRPKAGAGYRIRLSVPSYGEVTAVTCIPPAPQVRVGLEKIRRSGAGSSYFHFRQDDFQLPGNCRAGWIKSFCIYKRNKIPTKITYPDNMYVPDSIVGNLGGVSADNPYFDQVNAVLDPENVSERGSNTEFEYFVRIPFRSLPVAFPALYSVELFSDTFKLNPVDPEFPDYPQDIVEYFIAAVCLRFIAPSEEYDRYFRSLYRQYAMEDDPSSPLFQETVHVYSNIGNGLGIFAGYNSFVYVQPVYSDSE